MTVVDKPNLQFIEVWVPVIGWLTGGSYLDNEQFYLRTEYALWPTISVRDAYRLGQAARRAGYLLRREERTGEDPSAELSSWPLTLELAIRRLNVSGSYLYFAFGEKGVRLPFDQPDAHALLDALEKLGERGRSRGGGLASSGPTESILAGLHRRLERRIGW
jgi:hypothetical protein